MVIQGSNHISHFKKNPKGFSWGGNKLKPAYVQVIRLFPFIVQDPLVGPTEEMKDAKNHGSDYRFGPCPDRL